MANKATKEELVQAQLTARLMAAQLASEHIPDAIETIVRAMSGKRESVRLSAALNIIRIGTTQQLVDAEGDGDDEKKPTNIYVLGDGAAKGEFTSELDRRVAAKKAAGK